jgi:hypothetical protein
MSLNPVRTNRSGGFQLSAMKVAGLAGLALGLVACELPPEDGGEVEAISNELMSVVRNTTAADRVTGTVDMVFSLSRLDPPTQATTAFFSTLQAGGNGFTPATPGAACTAGVDFLSVVNRPITFPAGVSTVSTTVTVCGDEAAEGTEHLFAKLVDANNQCEGELCLGIGRITDNPGLSINDVGIREPVTGGRAGTFTITLSQAVPRDVTFTVTRVNDTAVTGFGNCNLFPMPDYFGGTGTLTIPANQLTATINVTVCGDRVRESTERFFLDLSNPVNATIFDGRGVGTITDTTLQVQFP